MVVAVASRESKVAEFYIPADKLIQANAGMTKTDEAFKGKVEKNEDAFFKDLGEKHPFEMDKCEQLYIKEPMIHAAVDKFVDGIVNGGFHVVSDDERAQELIADFLRANQFEDVLRQWIREGLVKGNGYLEIGYKDNVPVDVKVLDACSLFVKRNDTGEVLEYSQYLGLFKMSLLGQKKAIKFSPKEIAHLPINRIGSCAYGYGIVYPVVPVLDRKLQAEKDLHTLLKRKANAPLHVKMGVLRPDGRDEVPADAEIQSMGQRLQHMNNVHEWATNPYVDFKVIDFGNIGEKFQFVLDYDTRQLAYGLQTPEVLFGAGNVPEGLAFEQGSAYQRRIESFQAGIEKVLETQLFEPILIANGLVGVPVEFEWGQPSDKEKREEITRVTELLKLFSLDVRLRKALEERLAELMELDVDLSGPTQLMDQAQPPVPGQNNPERKAPLTPPAEGPEEHAQSSIAGITTPKPLFCSASEGHDPALLEGLDMSIREWVRFDETLGKAGFNYEEYVADVVAFIRSKRFEAVRKVQFAFVAGTDQRDWEVPVDAAGNPQTFSLHDSLTKPQIGKLREVLAQGFTHKTVINGQVVSVGKTIREIAKDVLEKVKPRTLELKDEDGAIRRVITPEIRSVMLAMVETSRASNEGALDRYEALEIKEAQWIARPGERTCGFCAANHLKVGRISEIRESIPAHVNCACSWIPVTGIGGA